MTSQMDPGQELNSNSTVEIPTPGVSCRKCDAHLPVRLAQRGEKPSLWECSTCSAQLPGIIVTECASQILARIRLADLHFDVSQVPELPNVLPRLVQKLFEQPAMPAIVERRRSVRVPKHLEVAYAPLDGRYSTVGGAHRAIIHNLSEHGVGFLSITPVDSPKVAIQLGNLGDHRLQVFGRVVRCRELGGKLFEVGVNLELRLGRRIL